MSKNRKSIQKSHKNGQKNIYFFKKVIKMSTHRKSFQKSHKNGQKIIYVFKVIKKIKNRQRFQTNHLKKRSTHHFIFSKKS